MPWPSITRARPDRGRSALRPLATVRIRLPWTSTSPGNGSAPEASSTMTSVNSTEPISASLGSARLAAHVHRYCSQRIAPPLAPVNGPGGARLSDRVQRAADASSRRAAPAHSTITSQTSGRPPAGEHGADARPTSPSALATPLQISSVKPMATAAMNTGAIEAVRLNRRTSAKASIIRNIGTKAPGDALVQPGQIGLARPQAVAAGGDDLLQLAELELARRPGEQLDPRRCRSRRASRASRSRSTARSADAGAVTCCSRQPSGIVRGRSSVEPLGQDAVGTATEDRDVSTSPTATAFGRQPDDVVAAPQPVVVRRPGPPPGRCRYSPMPHMPQLGGGARHRQVVDRELDRDQRQARRQQHAQNARRAHADAPDHHQLAVAQQVGHREQSGDQGRDRHQLGQHDRQPQAEIAQAGGEAALRAPGPARARRRSGRSPWRSR